MRPNVRRFADIDALIEASTANIAAWIRDAIETRGACRIALAGGGTPRPIYECLVPTAGLDWNRIEVLWGDERCVPPDHEASNYRMADRALLSHVAIPAGNVHRIQGELPPEEAARAYEAVVGDRPIDLVLLGMGDDGHTASLFPGGKELDAVTRVATAVSPIAPRDRVTLTFRALAEARVVVFVIAGASKADRLAEVAAQIESGKPVLPAARVAPANGELWWYVDAAAAAKL